MMACPKCNSRDLYVQNRPVPAVCCGKCGGIEYIGFPPRDEEADLRMDEAYKVAVAEEIHRLGLDVEPDHECMTPGCENMTKGAATWCEECATARYKAQKREWYHNHRRQAYESTMKSLAKRAAAQA